MLVIQIYTQDSSMALVSNFLMSASLYVWKITEDPKALLFIWARSISIYHIGKLTLRHF